MTIPQPLIRLFSKDDRAAWLSCGDLYPASLWEYRGDRIMMVRLPGKPLLAEGGGVLYSALSGEEHDGVKCCPRSHENALTLRRILPAVAPRSHRGHSVSLGLGDRLGWASPGHLRALKGTIIFPILAQQSMRELNLTHRTYPEVLDAAMWAVLQEGWTGGYGADGDHLKTLDEIRTALDAGYSMITLDCSEHIAQDAAAMTGADLAARYLLVPAEERAALEAAYLGKSFTIGGHAFTYDEEAFRRTVLVYRAALAFTRRVWDEAIASVYDRVDFELSIDETATPTSPAAHYLIASELKRAGVRWNSLAPRFCGYFEKGIDYVGDIARFTSEFAAHEAIAEAFGYKISVHSGSDKFSVFPVVGRLAPAYHLKTAGTNWLEAVRVIAAKEPDLYRRMHAYALEHLSEARAYYVISSKAETIPALDTLPDGDLPGLMDRNDARQCLHITYGLLLGAFHGEIYAALALYEEDYLEALKCHIGRHIAELSAR